MAEPTRRKKWSDVKVRLEALDRKGLVSLLGDLYDANVANRRFLHSRLITFRWEGHDAHDVCCEDYH